MSFPSPASQTGRSAGKRYDQGRGRNSTFSLINICMIISVCACVKTWFHSDKINWTYWWDGAPRVAVAEYYFFVEFLEMQIFIRARHIHRWTNSLSLADQFMLPLRVFLVPLSLTNYANLSRINYPNSRSYLIKRLAKSPQTNKADVFPTVFCKAILY